MPTFDAEKSKKAKLTSIISAVYTKSTCSEKKAFLEILLDGFSSAQIEILLSVCRTIFRSKRNTFAKSPRREVPIDSQETILLDENLTEAVTPFDFDDDTAKDLLYDILAKLPLNFDNASPTSRINAPSLSSVSRLYFLNRSKTRDLGRMRMVSTALSSRASSASETERSTKSLATKGMNPKLGESLSIVVKGWKTTDRFELFVYLLTNTEEVVTNALYKHIMRRLTSAANISYLPDHLMLYILTFLRPNDISRCAATCRRWRELARSQRLWRFKCMEMGRRMFAFPDLPLAISRAVQTRTGTSTFSNDSTHVDWRAVCTLVSQKRTRSSMRSSMPSTKPKTTSKQSYQKRRIVGNVVEDNNQIDEFDNELGMTDQPQLPPVEMFTEKEAKRLADKNRHDWDSDDYEIKPLPIGDKKDDGKSTADEDMSQHKLIFTQARSIIKPTVPVFPDVEKPYKSALINVLDTKVMQGHMGVILCLFFDNVRLYSGGADNTVRLWHPRGGRCLLKFLGHKGGIHTLDYCKDTATLFSGSWDTTIRMWDVGNSKAAGVMSGHRGTVTSIKVISRSYLLSSSSDGTLKLWNTTGCDCVSTCSLMPAPASELQPLLKIAVLSATVTSTKTSTTLAALCADGSVYISSMTLVSFMEKLMNPSLKLENETKFVHWRPWTSLRGSNQSISQQGTALALHGELLVVATFGQRRRPPVILGGGAVLPIVNDQTLSRSESTSTHAYANESSEGGIVWLSRFTNTLDKYHAKLHHKLSKKISASSIAGDQFKNSMPLPQLFAAINVRAMPTALFIIYGKLYIGFIDGAVQIWDLGDLVQILEIRPHTSRVRDIKAGPTAVTTCDDDGHVVVTRTTPIVNTKS